VDEPGGVVHAVVLHLRWTGMVTHAQQSLRRFIAMLVASAVSFFAVGVYSQYIQREIAHDAQEIATIVSPSIGHLSTARSELHRLEAFLASDPSRTYAPADFEAVARHRVRIRAELDAYLALPAFPAERELWKRIDVDLREVDRLVDEILIRWRERDVADADELTRRKLPATLGRAAATIAQLVEFHAAEARLLADSITATRRRATLVESGLGGLCVLFTLGSVVLLRRAIRHYQALVRERDRFLEQRAEELEQFAGRVAHDILSPLGSTGMALGIAAKSIPADARAQGAIERGQKSLTRVKRIVDGLLEFARAGAQPAPDARAELAPVVEDVVSEVQAAALEEGIAVCAGPVPRVSVRASEGVLTSVLANLLRNAVKYMGDAPERHIEVRVADLGSRVRVEVADTGPGIPRNLQPSIFEPYVRGSSSGVKGIGLGLATVKRIVGTHGGEVGLRSSVGAGSVFWFELPKAEDGETTWRDGAASAHSGASEGQASSMPCRTSSA
jgi:signal transduction histidine kinase